MMYMNLVSLVQAVLVLYLYTLMEGDNFHSC